MKKKMDQEENARRQEWRDKHYEKPAVARPHHMTKEERITAAKPDKPLMSPRDYMALLFHVDPKPAKAEKKPFVKARTRKTHPQA